MNLIGETFGRWTVVKRGKYPYDAVQLKAKKNPPAHWVCLCQCGTKRTVAGHNLISGKTKSCGCYRRHVLRTRKPSKQTRKKRLPVYVPSGRINFRESRMPINTRGSLSVSAIMMPFQSVVI